MAVADDTSDLLERLRDPDRGDALGYDRRIAADEIERLRKALLRVQRGNGYEFSLPKDVADLVNSTLIKVESEATTICRLLDQAAAR